MGIIQIQGHTFHPRFLNKESLVFDLGANHGDFARQIAGRFGCRCIAVEANKALAEAISTIPDLEVVHASIGGSDGIVEFAITVNDQCSSLLQPKTSEVIRREQVQMMSLDSLLNRYGEGRIDLVKMDIEGAEVMVVNACSDATLRRIGQLALEFHESLGMTSHADIVGISTRLRSLGFERIRGTFTNFEDNLFINRSLCEISSWDLFLNRTCSRMWNGAKRVIRRILQKLQGV